MNIYQKMLTDYMADAGINQRELAQRLQVRPPTLTNWLRGGHGITAKNRTKIDRLCASSMIAADVGRKAENDLLLWYLNQPEQAEQRYRLLLKATIRHNDEVKK